MGDIRRIGGGIVTTVSVVVPIVIEMADIHMSKELGKVLLALCALGVLTGLGMGLWPENTVKANRRRAYFAVRYLDFLAREIHDGRWPAYEKARFDICLDEINQALSNDLGDLHEWFLEIKLALLSAKELLASKKNKVALLEQVTRAHLSLQKIDAAMKLKPARSSLA